MLRLETLFPDNPDVSPTMRAFEGGRLQYELGMGFLAPKSARHFSSGLSWRVLISTSQVEARVRARMLRKIGNPFAAREQLRRMRHPEVTQVVNETLEQSRRGDQRCHSQQTRGERITTSDLQH
jgi:hypothetical protein